MGFRGFGVVGELGLADGALCGPHALPLVARLLRDWVHQAPELAGRAGDGVPAVRAEVVRLHHLAAQQARAPLLAAPHTAPGLVLLHQLLGLEVAPADLVLVRDPGLVLHVGAAELAHMPVLGDLAALEQELAGKDRCGVLEGCGHILPVVELFDEVWVEVAAHFPDHDDLVLHG